MTYRIIKFDCDTELEIDCGGGYTAEEVKAITKGYRFNGLFYDRNGSKYFYVVDEEK